MKKNVNIPTFLLLGAALFFLNFAASGQAAASDVFLKIKGSRQGDISGSVTERGKEGSIKIVSCQNGNLSPRDAASGQATGKRQHKPITITKMLDKSSPQLMKAFSTKEILPEVTLRYFGKSCPGGVCYTIELKDVVISNLTTSTDGNGQTMEAISLSFQKIEWKYNESDAAVSPGRVLSGN